MPWQKLQLILSVLMLFLLLFLPTTYEPLVKLDHFLHASLNLQIAKDFFFFVNSQIDR